MRNALKNASYKLLNEGYLFMTIPDASVIIKKLRK